MSDSPQPPRLLTILVLPQISPVTPVTEHEHSEWQAMAQRLHAAYAEYKHQDLVPRRLFLDADMIRDESLLTPLVKAIPALEMQLMPDGLLAIGPQSGGRAATAALHALYREMEQRHEFNALALSYRWLPVILNRWSQAPHPLRLACRYLTYELTPDEITLTKIYQTA